MPLFWGSRAREGQRMEGRTRRAREGWAAREDQAGVQAAGWAIWRWAQKSTAKTKWGRSTLRTTASKICPSCGKTRGRGINHSSSSCLISGGSGQGFEACVQRLKLNFSKVCRNTAIMPENMAMKSPWNLFLGTRFYNQSQKLSGSVWEADPGQFPCLRGGERIFLTANTMSHRVRLGRRQPRHFGFLTYCRVKTDVIKVSYSEWVAGGLGLSDRTCLGFLRLGIEISET